MVTPAFVVEGKQEQKAVGCFCKCPTVTINNGKSVSLNYMANQIAKCVKSFNNRYYPIYVIFDREDRKESSSKIIEEVYKLLEEKYEVKQNQVIIGVPDPKFESWLLPYINELGEITNMPNCGYDGKKDVEKLIKERLKIKYKKVDLGAKVAGKSKFKELENFSKSFEEFHKKVKPHCTEFQ